MNEVTILAIDLAKLIFDLCGVDARGAVVLQKQLRRAHLLQYIAQLPPCLVVMEAGGGAHYWARQIRALGHQVRLIAGHYVKACNCGQKNNRNDAQAIARAARQPASLRWLSRARSSKRC